MAKQKLTLTPNPTFKAVVQIPVPGDSTAPVEFTFKYRDREALQKFGESVKDKEDVDLILDMASGWDLAEPFDKDSVDTLVKNYVGAPIAILDKYMQESTGVRAKN